MDDYIKKQRVKQMFGNKRYKSGEIFSKTEQTGQVSTLEILAYLGKQFGTEDVYAIKANISYFQDGADSFSVKTERELNGMIERESYQRNNVLKNG